MHKRTAIARLHDLARQFPAVLILGARQVGKTTLARAAFPGLILDEAQVAPHVTWSKSKPRVPPRPIWREH